MDPLEDSDDLEELRRRNIDDNRRVLAELGLVSLIKGPSFLKDTLKTKPECAESARPKCTVLEKRKKHPRYLKGPHSHNRRCCIKTHAFTSEKIQPSDNEDQSEGIPDPSMDTMGPVTQRVMTYMNEHGTKRRMRVLSLFDGIGTGFVALKELGIDVEVYYTCEINMDAVLVAMSNHSISYLGDVMCLDRNKVERLCPIDLVLAGPPCNDLSIVNPARQGFNGTGKLIFKFLSIMKQIEAICGTDHHVYWLLENTGHMPIQYQQTINNIIGMDPVRCDAKYFSGQRRARHFWGNIPDMCSSNSKDEPSDQDLESALLQTRRAMVPHSRTITTSRNSYSITNGTNDGLVIEEGVQCDIWLQELERLFGFPCNYTDTANLTEDARSRLLGRAWSVPVITHLLSPLTHYYKNKQY